MGRISSASSAVELFLSKNETVAEKYAQELCEINRERQFTENKIAEEAYEYIEENLQKIHVAQDLIPYV